MNDHNLVSGLVSQAVAVSHRSVLDRDGNLVNGLHNVWITLDNQKELNSYTTPMLKGLILALREASNDRAAVAVILTGAGTAAFCTGGNTRQYAEEYAGRPGEYRQYMRLFNDAVTSILQCDKPVICRVNGMRVGGGQELGMACDFSIASDLAIFSQAGPKHGSAPDGGSTDFLPLVVGIERISRRRGAERSEIDPHMIIVQCTPFHVVAVFATTTDRGKVPTKTVPSAFSTPP
jgi:6-oxo-cyclohex-1-ene-carbonyl-CoA hydrolase